MNLILYDNNYVKKDIRGNIYDRNGQKHHHHVQGDPEPPQDTGAVLLGNQLAPEASNRGVVHPAGQLEAHKGEVKH